MSDAENFTDSIQNYDMPSRKAILQYLVRMGSFTSAPKIPNVDDGDLDVDFPSPTTWIDLQERCKTKLLNYPKSIHREFLELGETDGESFRIMQWNVLAQALAEGSDGFKCPLDSLEWNTRRWRLLTEMTNIQPDVLCMQEVDHFQFFERALGSIGFVGIFCPKPDSPCLYIQDNNGPDGCALFVNTSRFDILDTKKRSLEVWGCQTNQVAIFCKLRRRSDGTELWVATTHLKARTGSFLAALRREQGLDLLDFIRSTAGDNTPLVLTGDLNADPDEPVHTVLKSCKLQSAYRNQEPSYTTWTIRGDNEHCAVLDYILYRPSSLVIKRVLRVPDEQDIGPDRVPSTKYPSDHFALVADLVMLNHNE